MKFDFFLIFLFFFILALHGQSHIDTIETKRLIRQADEFFQSEQYAKSLSTYIKALRLAEKTNSDEDYFTSMRKIANVYAVYGDLERSLYYNTKAYEAAVKRNDVNMQSLLLTNLVGVSYLQKNLTQMKKFLELQLKTPMDDRVLWRYYQLCNQGYLSQLEENYKLGIFYHRQAFVFAIDHQMQPIYVADQLNEIGKAYMKNEEYEEAILSFLEAHKYAQDHNLKELDVNILRLLTQAYERTEKRDSVNLYKSLYLSISDSLFDKRQFSIVQDSLFEYEKGKTDKQISSLNTQLSHLLRIVLGSALLLAITISVVVIITRSNRRLKNAHRALIDRNAQLLRSVEENKILRKQYLENLKESEQSELESTAKRKEDYLSPELRQILLTRITTVMEDITIISSSDFSLQTLANMVGSNTKYVSWVINDTYQKNFKSLLNEYRIREACRRLSDYEKYGNITLQALASDIGYNSPTSFIQAFKRINSMPPSVYQKLVMSKEEHE